MTAAAIAAGQHARHHARYHAMSIDVEEHFQVWALAGNYPKAHWDQQTSRVAGNTHKLLDALAERGQRATFFVLGWVAQRHPLLVQEIAQAGHEVASHGHEHDLVYKMGPDDFAADIQTSKAILQDITGEPVIGYRAPSFSIGEQTPWAYELLAEAGYRYSSSSHPVANDHYGGRRKISVPETIDGIMEIPISTLQSPIKNVRLPFAGGGYFRLLPLAWSLGAVAHLARRQAQPIMFYLHPWEIDPDQPRPNKLSLKTRLRHYRGLGQCYDRFCQLLDRHQWRPIDELYGFRGARL